MKNYRGILAGVAVAVMVGWAVPSFCDPAADYQEAVNLYGTAQYDASAAKAQAVTTADPNHWQAWQLIGNCKYAKGDQAGALAAYRQALAINPNNPQLKSFADQIAASQPAAAPANADASYQAAVTAYGAQDNATAESKAGEAVAANPNHWQAWQLLGNCRYARGDTAGALDAYRKSLAANPDNPQLKAWVDSQPATPASTAQQPTQPSVAPSGPKPGGITIGLFGGYSMMNWSEHKKNMDKKKESQALIDPDHPATVSIPMGSMGGGIGAEWYPSQAFGVGAKFSMLMSSTAKYKYDGSYPFMIWTVTEKETYDVSISAMMLQIGILSPKMVLGGFNLNGFLYAGYGTVSMTIKGSADLALDGTPMDSSSFSVPASGTCFPIEIGGTLEYPFPGSNQWAAFLDIGYLIATAKPIAVTKDVPEVGLKSGDTLKDEEGNDEDVNFGGIQVRLGVKYTF